MSQIDLTFNRLSIAVYGVSAEIVEAAVDGLDRSLRTRIGVADYRGIAARDLSELSTTPIRVHRRLGPAELRDLIANQIADTISNLPQAGDD